MTWRQVPAFDPEAPAPTLGWTAIDWMEAYLCHGPGDIQGRPYRIDDEVRAFLLRAYELVPDETHPLGWRRRFDRVVFSRPKGRAKSEVGGATGCFESLGWCRFDGFDADGEPVGRPITSPEILVAATAEDQTGNTYDNVSFMLEYLLEHHGDEPGFEGIDIGRKAATSTRVYLPGGGVVEPITSKAMSKDGGKSTFVVFDEPHLWFTPELRALHQVIRRNLGKRGMLADPWSLETTTMYRPGQGSIAENAHRYADRIAKGKIANPRFLLDHREADEGLGEIIGGRDHNEHREQIVVQLTKVYGDAAAWTDFERYVDELDDPETDPADWERYRFNREVTATDAFCGPDEWEPLRIPELWIPKPKTLVAAGFDGSRFRDATALVFTDLATGHQWVIDIWERPADAGDTFEIDRADVRAQLAEAFDTWDVFYLYGDPPEWESELGEWAAAYGKNHCGKPRVQEWWTNRTTYMSRALKAYRAAIRGSARAVAAGETPELTHDGDSRLQTHITNAQLRRNLAANADPGEIDRELWSVHKRKPSLKIDGLLGATLSWQARTDAIADGALTTPRQKRYRSGSF